VTIAIGFAFDGGLLFCADTKITGDIQANQSKIVRYSSTDGNCSLVFALSSADINFPMVAVSGCWQYVRQIDFSTVSIETVHHAVQESLGDFYRDHIYPHPDRTPGAFFIELLVGIWLRGESKLYLSHETVLSAVEQYECVGAGSYLAKYIIGQYKKANHGAIALQDAALISYHAVQAAIDYDARCGGKPEMLIVTNNGNPDQARERTGYPREMFIDVSLELYWKMVHDLANMKAEDQWGRPCDERIDLLSKQLRDLDTSCKWS
jgi:20S proteasome alpha/beta subunit